MTSADGETSRRRISPGALVEIKGDGIEDQVVWDVDDEMTFLCIGEMLDEQQKAAIALFGVLAAASGLAYYYLPIDL